MKKQYFAWKDGTHELAEITTKEFFAIAKQSKTLPLTERRYFARIPGVTEDDVYYFLECDYENYKKSVAESQERYRKRMQEQQLRDSGKFYKTISLDYEVDDGNGDTVTLHDVVADIDSFFENSLIEYMDLEAALDSLSEDEMESINAFYLSDNPKTEREYAAELGVSYMTVHYRKVRILKKLKSFLCKTDFSVTIEK